MLGLRIERPKWRWPGAKTSINAMKHHPSHLGCKIRREPRARSNGASRRRCCDLWRFVGSSHSVLAAPTAEARGSPSQTDDIKRGGAHRGWRQRGWRRRGGLAAYTTRIAIATMPAGPDGQARAQPHARRRTQALLHKRSAMRCGTSLISYLAMVSSPECALRLAGFCKRARRCRAAFNSR
jgi:hypothetical protein